MLLLRWDDSSTITDCSESAVSVLEWVAVSWRRSRKFVVTSHSWRFMKCLAFVMAFYNVTINGVLRLADCVIRPVLSVFRECMKFHCIPLTYLDARTRGTFTKNLTVTKTSYLPFVCTGNDMLMYWLNVTCVFMFECAIGTSYLKGNDRPAKEMVFC